MTSPTSPRVGENVNFNAATSRPATGRTIRSYDWDFGDGVQKNHDQSVTAHDYQSAGTFTVTLVVTDDVGREPVATATVTVEGRFADRRLHVLAGAADRGPYDSVQFVGLVGGYGPHDHLVFLGFRRWLDQHLASPAHPYSGAASFNVTLTITDSAGKTGRVTKSVSVQ